MKHNIPPTKTLSVRLERAEYEALETIARFVGHGATPTGVLRELVRKAMRDMGENGDLTPGSKRV